MRDFQLMLQEQLRSIKVSVETVMAGNPREAVRIATAIRVIAHQPHRGESKSLLTHLGTPDPEMLATGLPLPENVVFGESGLTIFEVNEHGMFMVPAFDKGPQRIISFSNWWTERVYVLGEDSLSRRELVLTAADKDGGAHVDGDLPKSYERFRRGLWFVNGHEGEMPHQAMLTLVQIGYEVNHSPGILSLAGPPRWG